MRASSSRKILAACLALLLVSGSVPAGPVADLFGGAAITASAANSGRCGENATWSFDTTTFTLTISGTGDMADYHYFEQTPWYVNKIRDSITSVVIEEGITSIGEIAFSKCTNLEKVVIPEGITSIGSYAFSECSKLKSVKLPSTLKIIVDNAFAESALESITIPPNVESIGSNAFKGCTGITDIYFFQNPEFLYWDKSSDGVDFKENKETVCHVPKAYFGEYTDKFGSVNVEFKDEESGQCGENAYYMLDYEKDKLLITGSGAMYDYEYNTMPWYDCKFYLASVEIENGITSICNNAFNSFFKLTSVSIPNSVKSIGESAFESCGDLESVEIGSGVTSIGESAFAYCMGLKSVEIGSGVTSIGNSAFLSCSSLKSITIPEKVTSIGESVFAYCESLESVEIGSGVESIGAEAFSECTSLTSVTIPDSVKSIDDHAFYSCTSLTSITIPDSVTSIGADAFFSCTNIKDVYCYAAPKNLTWIEDGCDDFIREPNYTTVCHVPAEYIVTDYSEKFSDVNVTFKSEAMGKCGDHATWLLDTDTGLLTISGSGEMYSYHIGENSPDWYSFKEHITSVVIEEGITSIGNDAFEECTILSSVTIPNGVTSIGDSAFYGCTGLTTVTIPASVTKIDNSAFAGCTNISDVYCYVANPSNLTWNDAYNDFMENRKTVCHVPKGTYDAYCSRFGYPGEAFTVCVTFADDIVDMGEGLGEHLYGHSISLEGDIGVNFYLELSDELLASETAKMVFTVPDGKKSDYQELFVSTVIQDDNNKVTLNGKTYYKFKCRISAKDMASNITAQLVDGEKSGKEYTYSVREYAEKMIAAPEKYLPEDKKDQGVALVKAMLNYGAYSQSYFGIEGTAANAGLDDADKALNMTIPEEFKYNDENTSLPTGVTFEGSTLSLKSETTLSLYFKGLSADTEFHCDDHTVETDKSGDYVIARVRGINAKDLENDLTVTIKGDTNLSVKYNPMTYCYNVQQSSTAKTELKNVCHALYEYAEAARLYFNN